MNTGSPQVRRVRFEFSDVVDPRWNPRFPEFSAAANGVSMLMPHVEPYVAASVSSALDQLDPELAERAGAFVAQERQHQAQHRRFNAIVTRDSPVLARLDRWMGRAYRWLSSRSSQRWSLAFAAGFETSAFALARWTEAHMRTLFDGADPQVSTLFLWHLAEEVEHKTVAFDVYEEVDGSRLRYLFAGLVSLSMLAAFTVATTLVGLGTQRRLLSPVAWWRLLVWSISLAFEVLPDLFVSAMPGHHPSQFSDPMVLTAWLRAFDPETATMPLWDPDRPEAPLSRSA